MQHRVIDKPTNIKNSDARKSIFQIVSMKRPTFTVRLTVEINFYAHRRFHEDQIFWKQRWRSLCFQKFSLKNSKFRFLSKSRHLPFVLKSLETRIKTMKIFLVGKLKVKEADIYRSSNFSL